MIRILHLINGLDIGGAETLLVRLLERMDPHSFQHEVVSLSGEGTLGSHITSLGIPVVSLKMRPTLPSLAGFTRLASKTSRFRPGIVQSWLYHSDLIGLSVAKAARVPAVVWSVHGCDLKLPDCSRLFRLMISVLAKSSRFVDAVVPVSQGSLDWHRQLGYRPRRWELIRVGVDTACFRPRTLARVALRNALGIPPVSLVIGIVARFHPMKGHEIFLRALAALRRMMPDMDIHGVMIGRQVISANVSLSNLVAELELDGRIHPLGERADVNKLMPGFDLLCSASHVESCPTAVLEAMACGVPCAVTDVGDSAFLVGSTGEVAPPGNPEALAHALLRLVTIGPMARERLGQKARRRVIEQFSLEVVVDKYTALYRSLLERKHEYAA